MLHAFDAMGEMIRSMWGHRYSTLVKDHHDGRVWSYAHARKDKGSLAKMLSHHEHLAKIDGRLTKVFEENGGLHDLRGCPWSIVSAASLRAPSSPSSSFSSS